MNAKYGNEPRFATLDASNDENKIGAVCTASNMVVVAIVDEEAGGVIGYVHDSMGEDICARLNTSISPNLIPSIIEEIKDALEGESNDAEHDALVTIAEALGVDYDPDAAYEED